MKIKCKGGVLHPGQLKIAQDILKTDATFYTIVTPRQYGKSFMIIQLMLYYALNNPNVKIIFLSPVYSQCAKIYKELLKGIQDAKIIQKFNGAENSIIFINGSEIYFKSMQIPDNIRGNTIDYVFCDEASYYKKDAFESVVIPLMAARPKAKCFLFSTPHGKNFFYEYYMKGFTNEPGFRSYKGKSSENPYRNQFIIDISKKSMPEAIFRQEFEAEFIDGNGSVFQNINKITTITKWSEPIPGEKYYVGIDIGITNDFLVMTVLDSKANVVYCYRDTKKSVQYLLEQMRIIFNKYNPQNTLVETNGVGNGIFDFIKKLHKSVSPFVTTNESKQEIIEDLIFAIQEQALHIPTKELFPYITEEMDDFGFTYKPSSRRVFYGSISGHDDTVMSLGFAYHALKHGATKGQYYIY